MRFWLDFLNPSREIFETAVGTSTEKKHAEELSLLESVNLGEHANVLARNYSGGMQRRLCVLIASVGHPDLLLLDEPAAGLDPVSRRKVWRLILDLKLQKPQRIILLATHDMAEADFLADKIGILSNGILKTVGSSLTLKSQYGSGFRLTLSLKQT